jgi:anti-sigma regulatory factor (Ser/Thr protein kinase)
MHPTPTHSKPLDFSCLAARTSAGQARSLIEYRLADWGLGAARLAEFRSDLCLAATELVGNATKVAPDAEIRVRLVPEHGSVLLGVWDSSNERPVPRPVVELELEDLNLDPARFDDNGGRGLALVLALAAETGITPTPPKGKWVWARFTMP